MFIKKNVLTDYKLGLLRFLYILYNHYIAIIFVYICKISINMVNILVRLNVKKKKHCFSWSFCIKYFVFYWLPFTGEPDKNAD